MFAAFLLADEGYDVWLGNARGNSWSRQHVNLTTEDNAFWDFSFHEIGTRDLPAIIDYVLEQTGVSSVSSCLNQISNSGTYWTISRFTMRDIRKEPPSTTL